MNYIAFPIALSYSFSKEDFFRFGGLALLVALIGISLFVLILARKGHNRKKESERHDYNVRLYRRNRLTKEFYCVDKKDLTNQKIFTQEEFLHQFTPSDKLRVKAWIDSISRGDYEEYFSAEIRLNKANRTCPTIREVTSINPTAHRIHFESYLVPYSKNTHLDKSTFINKFRANHYLIKKEEDARKFLASSTEESMGALFAIKIFSDSVLTKEENKKKNDAIYRSLTRFLGKKMRLFRNTPDEFIILDKTTFSKFSARNLASTLATSLQQQVNRGLPTRTLTVGIGASLAQDHKGNFRIAIQQALKMCRAIGEGKAKKQRFLFYDSTFFTNYETQKAEQREVKNRIRNKTFRLYYTPCLDLSSTQTDRSKIKPTFYLAEFIPYGRKYIKGREDVYAHTKDRPGASIDLFGRMNAFFERNSKSSQQKASIVLQLPYSQRKNAEIIFSHSNADYKFIFLLSEVDILNSSEEIYITRKNIRERKKRGFIPALLLDATSPVLRSRILKQFGYFFVSPKYASIDRNDKGHSDLRTIQNNYKGYSVPFVYYGLKTTEQAELASHYGARYLLCDSLALPSSRLEPFDSKKVGFFIDDAKKLAPKQNLLLNLGNKED